ncbi:MAG TPA: hypothetical protein VFZ34_28515, partial [Blastocatellia bacterium]|nr:hypothetical protein [Blastocatellia bacterium]
MKKLRRFIKQATVFGLVLGLLDWSTLAAITASNKGRTSVAIPSPNIKSLASLVLPKVGGKDLSAIPTNMSQPDEKTTAKVKDAFNKL